tara:strand:- start:70 stop:516 length:447 start_codon:yes stop_codon:yes gene_type:complete
MNKLKNLIHKFTAALFIFLPLSIYAETKIYLICDENLNDPTFSSALVVINELSKESISGETTGKLLNIRGRGAFISWQEVKIVYDASDVWLMQFPPDMNEVNNSLPLQINRTTLRFDWDDERCSITDKERIDKISDGVFKRFMKNNQI